MRGFLSLILVAIACSSNEPVPAARATTTTAAPAVAAGANFQKLVGRWLRDDMSYMIEITSVTADGKLEARYLNPQPIHVSKAEARQENGALEVVVELTDRGYPGSYYTVTYSPVEDFASRRLPPSGVAAELRRRLLPRRRRDAALTPFGLTIPRFDRKQE